MPQGHFLVVEWANHFSLPYLVLEVSQWPLTPEAISISGFQHAKSYEWRTGWGRHIFLIAQKTVSRRFTYLGMCVVIPCLFQKKLVAISRRRRILGLEEICHQRGASAVQGSTCQMGDEGVDSLLGLIIIDISCIIYIYIDAVDR